MKKEQIVYKKVSELKGNAKNPRKNDGAVDTVAKSIEKYGFRNPLIIDADNVVWCGNTRLKASKKLGLEEVPCIVVTDLDEQKMTELALLDNKTNEIAEWDTEMLAEILPEVDFAEFGEISWDIPEIEEVKEVVEDDFDCTPPEEPKAKLGDIYQLGNHRLMCGDSTDALNINILMNGEKADIVYTDPPYGMNLDTDFSDMVGIGKGNKYKTVKGDTDDFSADLINTVFTNFNYCKEIFLWGADYFAELLPNRNDGSWIVWDKQNNGEGCNDAYDKMFGSNFELCWSKNKHKRALARVLWKGFFGMQNEDTKKRIHPTQKPIELAKWFLEKFSKENDIVVDIYGGSGSTLICCEKMKRRCYMLEYDAAYVDAIIKRWETLTGKKAEKIC